MGLIGTGKVARALAEVMHQQASMLYGRFGTEFHVRALMNSTHMALSETAFDLRGIDQELEANKR